MNEISTTRKMKPLQGNELECFVGHLACPKPETSRYAPHRLGADQTRSLSNRKSAEAISLRRILRVDCQHCAGFGCSTCFETGLA